MDLTPFIQGITSVTGPVTLIAFIVVVLLAMLIAVLKYTRGLNRIQDWFYENVRLQPGEFRRIVNAVLFTLIVIAAMLFALLAYNYYVESQKPTSGLACFGEKCTGRDPKDAGCDIGVATITSRLASFPKFGEEFKNIKIEMRHSDRCNASWVRAKAPVGSTLYLEGQDNKKYVSTTIQDDGITEPHYTDMGPGNVKRRACVEDPEGNIQCTEFIK